MNEFIIKNINGVETVDSRQVAEAIDKKHYDLIKDIRRYSEYLNDGKISAVDFFIEDTYTDSKGEIRPCYNVTRKGCDLIANKLTGKKGVTFTALYVNAFHGMSNFINNNVEKLDAAILNSAAKLVNANRLIMKDQGSHPSKIAQQTELIYRQAGVVPINGFVEKDPFENQLFLDGYSDNEDLI